VAIVGRDEHGQGVVVSQVLQSQFDLVRRYGGVFPNEARRQHELVIDDLVEAALTQAQVTGEEVEGVAVTLGPGLAPCLGVGMRKAEQLARQYHKPLFGVHHVAAHTLMPLLTNPSLKFPLIALVRKKIFLHLICFYI
jgi:N6-L-threonylcarbamoyladenine synthase